MAEGGGSGDVEVPVQYPLRVEYCDVCSMPPEYCENSPDPAQCHEWMKTNLPTYYARIVEKVGDQLEDLTLEEGKRQTRGGKALRKARKKVKMEEVKRIKVSRSQRSKRKVVTVVVGLKTCAIDLKKASKVFAQHFSCGSSVTGEDEIVVQGDVCDDIIDFLQEKWPEIDEDMIEFVGDQKR